MSTPSYEDILAKLLELEPAPSHLARNVEWLTSAEVVGISRTLGGRIEVFLAGDQLVPRRRVVRRAVDFQSWDRSTANASIFANRILLPAAGHFDQVAAFLCAELLRNGVDQDLALGFMKTEPLIEIAVTKLRLTDQALLGLIGELILLDALLRSSPGDNVRDVLGSWRGWRESARDFSWNSLGIEVKTTSRKVSSHQVEGVHQVERIDHAEGGGEEGALFLVSIGVQWLTDVNDGDLSYSLPEIVESIVERVREALSHLEQTEALADVFLDHVAQYGNDLDVGYDHRTMADSSVFARRFTVLFSRCYDMSDPAIEVLRSEDLIPFSHVDAESVRFRVVLPPRVRGDVNPIVGLHASADRLIAIAQEL